MAPYYIGRPCITRHKASTSTRVRRYVVTATKPMHRLQIRPIVPPTIPPSYIRVRAVMCECGEGQTDKQTAVTTIHFVSAKCKNNDEHEYIINYSKVHQSRRRL